LFLFGQSATARLALAAEDFVVDGLKSLGFALIATFDVTSLLPALFQAI
jgi:hypothetical protein